MLFTYEGGRGINPATCVFNILTVYTLMQI